MWRRRLPLRVLRAILVGVLLGGLGQSTAERSSAAPLPIRLAFDGGDPGIPGDGVVFQLPPGGNRFSFTEPIPASSVSGQYFTAAIFPTADDRIASITVGVWSLDESSPCKGAVYIGGSGDSATVTVDGVAGVYQNFDLSLAYNHPKFTECHLMKDDLFIGDFLLANDSRSIRPQDYLITKIDAAYIGLDKDVYPGDSAEGQ